MEKAKYDWEKLLRYENEVDLHSANFIIDEDEDCLICWEPGSQEVEPGVDVDIKLELYGSCTGKAVTQILGDGSTDVTVTTRMYNPRTGTTTITSKTTRRKSLAVVLNRDALKELGFTYTGYVNMWD